MVIASTLISGCTKEDLSACNPGVQLKFSYLLNEQGVNLFGDEINQVTVFAFDANGQYHSTFSDTGNHLTNDYTMRLSLPVGKYTLISWAGDMSQYDPLAMIDESQDVRQPLTPGHTTLEQFRLLVKHQQNTEQLGLYYGHAFEVESMTTIKQIYPIELTKNSNTIRVSITGLGNLPESVGVRAVQTPKFDVTVTARNGRYNFENNIPSAAKTVIYKPHTIFENDNELRYDCNVLRLMIGRQPMLKVVNNLTGEEICNFNIVEAILLDPKYRTQLDIDKSDFFRFDIAINQDLSTTISINGWEIVEVTPGL